MGDEKGDTPSPPGAYHLGAYSPSRIFGWSVFVNVEIDSESYIHIYIHGMMLATCNKR